MGSNIDSQGCILIVDDMAINARLLASMLKIAGYATITASNGPEALAILGLPTADIDTNGTLPPEAEGEACAAEETPAAECEVPDVVLLDVMMPGLDGFETCRRIKAAPETSWLPVVMVTALHETEDRVTALEAGADDFLTKPVDEVEVVARVRSLVRIKRQRDELERAYDNLQHAEEMRDNLATMLVHDLRTPLTTLLTPLDMLATGQLGDLDQSQEEIVKMCERSAEHLLRLVNQLLDIHKLENGHMELEPAAVEARELILGALEEVEPATVDRKVSFETNIESGLPEFTVDRDLIERVLMNLLGNAVRYTPVGGRIRIDARRDPGSNGTDATVVFSVRDEGPGIEPEHQQRIFDKFGSADMRRNHRDVSTGLGLTFCKLAVEAHNGAIWVDSTPGQGSTFSFTVPV